MNNSRMLRVVFFTHKNTSQQKDDLDFYFEKQNLHPRKNYNEMIGGFISGERKTEWKGDC